MSSCTIDADLISQLPDHIIHQILSFLPTKDVVRLSVLSKEWYGFFTYFPIFDFSNSYFGIDYQDYFIKVDRTLEFVKFVYTSLLRQSLHSRNVPKFELSLTRKSKYISCTTPQLKHKLTVLINRCIRLGTQYGVKELALEFPYDNYYYRLPKAIFFSAKQLVVCKLAYCSIDAPTINLPSLRELSLKVVYLCDQRIIHNLVFTCPFIEKFTIAHCSGLDYLTLSGFTKLKKVKVRGRSPNKIEVDALSLQNFFFSVFGEDTEINIIACKNLEVLKIKNSSLTVGAIQDLISKFSALKVLVLDFDKVWDLDANEFESIKISNQRLEKLKLCSDTMVETIIDAPRLKSLKYLLGKIPSLFSVSTASLLEVDIVLLRHCRLLELNKFLKNFNQVELVNLYIPYHISCGFPEIVSSISSAIINRLELNIKLNNVGDHAKVEAAEEALVNGLFWACHPKSLLIVSGWDTNNEFMKFLCKKLVLREKEQNCCAASNVKCWLHELKGVNIEHCRRNGERKVLTCDVLLDSLETLAPLALDEKIYFVFQW